MLIITSVNCVYASTEFPEITDDIEIKYRWYKEKITGDYYPLQTITSEDLVDVTKIKFSKFSGWDQLNCRLNSHQYLIEQKTANIYTKVESVRYVVFKNFKYNNNIKIYNENKQIDFKIISQTEEEVKIDMNRSYLVESLLFIVDTSEKYKIAFYAQNDFKKEIISKEIEGTKIFSANKDWITDKTVFVNLSSEINYPTSDLTRITSINYYCRYREIYVYKYEMKREYYDENYYLNVDGYIKDTDDYKIYYKGEPITNTIEITKEKIVKVPQTKYVYIETEPKKTLDENNEIENDTSEEVQKNTCSNEKEFKIVEKEIFKIPKRTYLIIIILIGIIICLTTTIIIFKKNVR